MHIFTSPNNFSKVGRKLLSLLTILILQTSFALAQDAPFITVWQTDNPGSSEDNQITIPGTGTDYLIEWEEVGNEANNSGSETGIDTHTVTFPSAGTYRVKISGDFNRVNFNNKGDKDKILEIEQWGDIVWQSFESAFFNCDNLEYSATDSPDLSQITTLSRMFENADLFNGEIGNWDVSTVTDMTYMFRYARSFNQDLNNWNVANVDRMFNMFEVATAFNGNITAWDVSNVQSMSRMFNGASTFNQDIGSWNVSSLLYANYMFGSASSFDADLSGWNFSGLGLQGMFSGASAFNQNLGAWNISSVTALSAMLDNSGISDENYDLTLKGWSNLANIPTGLTLGAKGLKYCSAAESRNKLTDEKGWTITGDIADCGPSFVTIWKTDNEGGSGSNQIRIPSTGVNYSIYWEEVQNVDNNGEEMGNGFHTITFPHSGTYRVEIEGDLNNINFSFSEDQFKIVDIENWGYIQWTSMNAAFAGAENLTISAIDAPNLSQVTDMSSMFYNAKSLKQDISKWSVGHVTDMSDLFHGASSFNQDLSNWDVSNVTKMTRMFARTDSFNRDLNTWNTENVEEMDFMFWDADAFQGNISEWNTSTVTNMWGMFYSADSFNTDISTWEVGNVTNMQEMFREAGSFNQDISGWNVSNVTGMYGMFYEAVAFDQNLGGWDLSNTESLFEFLSYSGLSLSNYDLSLEGWATSGNVPSDLAVSVDELYYCVSAEYRQQLIDQYGWGIIGDETCSLAMQETMPVAEATSVEKDSEIYLTFDQEIEEIDFSGITLKDISGKAIALSDIYIDSLTLHLVHGGLGSNTYEVVIPESSIISIMGKENEAISWSFTTQRVLSSKDGLKSIDHSTFPNPFSAFTTIQFNLPQSQSVNLLIFDLKGQIVRKEQYDNLDSDKQSIQFERKDLPAGLYRYQLQSAGGSFGGKMLVK